MAHLFESPEGLIPTVALAAALTAALLFSLGRGRSRPQRLMGPTAPFAVLVPDLMLVLATAALGLALCGP